MHLIQYATESDGPALAKVNVRAFQHRLLLGAVFPESSQTMLEEYKVHVGMKHLANPNMHVIKIHNHEELVAYSRWQFPASLGESRVTLSEQAAVSAQNPLAFAPKPMNEAPMASFKKILQDARKKYTKEDDILLDFLATLPEYQGQGYGSAILKWGIEKADATGSRIFLEATPEGVPLYLKYGWRHLEEVRVDYADYGRSGVESYYLMIRDPVS